MRRSRPSREQSGTAEGSLVKSKQDGRWDARPGLARALRCAAFVAPVAVSVAGVYVASQLVPPPRGSIGLFVAWWAALSLGATVVLAVAGRLTRRLLPLATLMRLSLVFPDGAPSRFRIALRTGTVATLEERLADARSGVAARTPLEAAELLLVLVAHLDTHDALTRGHSERVRAYAQSIGNELGLDRRELDLLNWAALLHDVGKLEVPEEILTKDGRLTDEEWELLKRHPLAGAELAAPLRDWLGEWAGAIDQHHERWDGGGYPRGLAGTEISRAGRIVAVADVYDVITSPRTYKQAGTVEGARRELARCAGSQFDPAIVRAFLAISVRPRIAVTGPLAWLGHASVLARAPLASTAGVVSAAAVALGVPATAPQGAPVFGAAAAPPAVRASAVDGEAVAVTSAAQRGAARGGSSAGEGARIPSAPEVSARPDSPTAPTETDTDGPAKVDPGDPTEPKAKPGPEITPDPTSGSRAQSGGMVDRSVKDVGQVVEDVGDVVKNVGENVGNAAQAVDKTVADVVSTLPQLPAPPPVAPSTVPSVPTAPDVPALPPESPVPAVPSLPTPAPPPVPPILLP